MNPRTESELLFEAFCERHQLAFVRILEDIDPRPDYLLTLGSVGIAVEIKQLDELSGFSEGGRVVGSHVRKAIDSSRKQMKWAEQQQMPAALLIYNPVDYHFQSFGTEEHDFLTAMYGELTINVSSTTRRLGAMYHGQNAKLRYDEKTRFSGVGHMIRADPPRITIYENAYAALPLPFDDIPQCIHIKRTQIQPTDIEPQ